MKKIFILASIAVLSISFSIKAETKTVTITTAADTDIRNQTSVNYAKGNRTYMLITNVPGTGISAKIYLRFTMPSDIGSITSATLKVVTGAVVTDPNQLTTQINVSGLNDGVAYEDTWTDASPGTYYGTPIGGLTWNNAPGNLISSTYLFDSNTTTLLGSFPMLGKGSGAAVGDVSTFSSQALIDFLSADKNGKVTLLLGKVNTETLWNGIVDRNWTPAGQYNAAQLQITYIVAPPKRFLKGDINQDLMVDLKDFAIMAQNWMLCPSPAVINCP